MTVLSRRDLLAVSLILAANPVIAAPKPPTVLFVCEFGTAKSAIARELFRRRAKERGIAVTAFSRGSKVIQDHVSPPLKATLAAEGIDSRRDGFAVLDRADIRRADVVVGFTPLPAVYRPRRSLDWTAVPSVNDAWPAARADLDRHIDALLDEIAARQFQRK